MPFRKSLDRREFLTLVAGGAALGLMTTSSLAQAAHLKKMFDKPRFKAIAFDAFTIFDPRPIFELVETLFPGKGTEFGRVWRNKQFDYAWLRLLSKQYEDFWKITEDALVYSARMLKVDLTPQKRDQLLKACLTLKAWPDVPVALRSLKEMGVKLAFLSNFTPDMIEANVRNAGLQGTFDKIICSGEVKSYKPAPEAYQLAIDRLGVKREEILFAPFAGWDAAGAKHFGLTTFWVDRIELPPEELGILPDAVGTTLVDVVQFVKNG